MIHPDTELRFISIEMDFGEVATKLIPKGIITWVCDSLDQIITPQTLAQLHFAQEAFLEK